jgi:hypothetical protein
MKMINTLIHAQEKRNYHLDKIAALESLNPECEITKQWVADKIAQQKRAISRVDESVERGLNKLKNLLAGVTFVLIGVVGLYCSVQIAPGFSLWFLSLYTIGVAALAYGTALIFKRLVIWE